jgi:hypothetical protein
MSIMIVVFKGYASRSELKAPENGKRYDVRTSIKTLQKAA